MQSRNVKITNKLGMHARPAALLTKTANLFGCKISITKNGKTIDVGRQMRGRNHDHHGRRRRKRRT